MTQNDNLWLQNEVNAVLWNSAYPELRSITAQVINGGVVLLGLAESYFIKQVAQTLIRQIPGVTSIRNQIAVFAEVGSESMQATA